jgi:hypothetical protein
MVESQILMLKSQFFSIVLLASSVLMTLHVPHKRSNLDAKVGDFTMGKSWENGDLMMI